MGQFTGFNGINRGRIARLHPDGPLDQTFDPGGGADGDVYAVAVQPDGKVVVGGVFGAIDGIANRSVARMNADGSVDDTFVIGANVNGELRAVAVQPDGKILIAGRFTSVAGQNRNRIARLEANGALDGTFDPGAGANHNIRCLALQSDGRILIGGQFTAFAGVSRVRVARLLSDGQLDPEFVPGLGANDHVRAIAAAADGTILIGGDFEIYDGINRSAVARLFRDGRLDPGFDPGDTEDDFVRAVLPRTDGQVWIGGLFQSAGGQSAGNLALLKSDGRARPVVSPLPDADNEIFALLADDEGRLLAGGKFGSTSGHYRSRIARWWQDSSVNTFEFVSATIYGNEIDGQAVVGVRRNGQSSNAVEVVCAVIGETATFGADFSAGDQTLHFGPLETLKTFVISIHQDVATEGVETVRLTLDQASPGRGPGGRALLEITDDAGRIEFNAETVEIAEAAGTAVLSVSRAGNLVEAVTVDFQTTNGSALDSGDYLARSGTLTFPPGVATAVVGIPILNDDRRETNEVFFVTLSRPAGGASIGARSNIVITIVDNELGLGFNQTSTLAFESYPTVRLTVVKHWDATNRVLVDYATRDGTATAGLDYMAWSGTLSFEPGESEKAIDIPLLADALIEGVENFHVLLSNVRGGPILGIGTMDVAIHCGSPCDSGIEFDASNYTVNDSSGSVTVGVQRWDDLTNEFTVEYWTSDGTALAGVDYAARAGRLTLRAGETNRDLTIPIARDGSLSGFKTFSVHLSDPSEGVELGARRDATLRILDDEQPGTLELTYNPTGINFPSAVVALPDGKVFVGQSRDLFGQTVARLNPDGTLDSSFQHRSVGGCGVHAVYPVALALDSDGRVITGGVGVLPDVELWGWYLARIEADGSNFSCLGGAFCYNRILQRVFSIHVQANGQILAGGAMRCFDSFLDPPVWSGFNILRVNPDGSSDADFHNPITDGLVTAITSQSDGKILVGGIFATINGTFRYNLARLLADGNIDPSFHNPETDSGCDGAVWAIVPLSDGKALIAGGFTRVHGVVRPSVARLNADGSVDTTFATVPPPNASIASLVVQNDGRILIGGYFTEVGGLSRPRVARLNSDGSVDAIFNPGSGPDGGVTGMTLLPDGDLLIVGDFLSFDELPRYRLAKLRTSILRFDPPVRRASGEIEMNVRGRDGTRIITQSSDDLAGWVPVATNTIVANSFGFTVTPATGPSARFYRVVLEER